MNKAKIEEIVFSLLKNYCAENKINAVIDVNTPLIGGNRILDSIGLVNFIVDVETAFLDEDVELSLTSEAAMSGRISPFRTVGALCSFIANQLGLESNE